MRGAVLPSEDGRREWAVHRRLATTFPPHATYVELAAGGAPALFGKPRARYEVLGDVRGDLIALYDALRDPETAGALAAAVALTPCAAAARPRAPERPRRGGRDAARQEALVERARRTLARAGLTALGGERAATGGGLRGRAPGRVRRAARAWGAWPRGVPAWTERLAGVVLEQADPGALVGDYDAPDTLFFAAVRADARGGRDGRGRDGGGRGSRARGGRAAATGRWPSAEAAAALVERLGEATGLAVVAVHGAHDAGAGCGEGGDALVLALEDAARGWVEDAERAGRGVRVWRNAACDAACAAAKAATPAQALAGGADDEARGQLELPFGGFAGETPQAWE